MLNWLVRLGRKFSVDDAPPRVDASTPGFPTVPSFKSPRSSSLELLEHARRTRYGWQVSLRTDTRKPIVRKLEKRERRFPPPAPVFRSLGRRTDCGGGDFLLVACCPQEPTGCIVNSGSISQ